MKNLKILNLDYDYILALFCKTLFLNMFKKLKKLNKMAQDQRTLRSVFPQFLTARVENFRGESRYYPYPNLRIF